MEDLLFTLGLIATMIGVQELLILMAHGSVRKISEENLDKYINETSLNPHCSSILEHEKGHISNHTSLFSTYHIYGYGCIPRKYNKKIIARYDELIFNR